MVNAGKRNTRENAVTTPNESYNGWKDTSAINARDAAGAGKLAGNRIRNRYGNNGQTRLNNSSRVIFDLKIFWPRTAVSYNFLVFGGQTL